MSAQEAVLSVSELKTTFSTPDGTVHAVNGVSFDLRPGEFLGVVGESGSGKSVTMMSTLRLIPMPPGEIKSGKAEFDDRDLLAMDDEELRRIRGGKIGFIFQDPMTSLNPVLTIGKQITESIKLHVGSTDKEADERAAELLTLVGIPDAAQRLKNYPHELSGGMRQRVMIAMALSCSPKVIVADEPTTALDVTIQAQIIELIRDLRERLNTSVIWITHDLGVIAGLADRVLVMYGGKIVEEAKVADLYARRLSTPTPRACSSRCPASTCAPGAGQHQGPAAEPLLGADRPARSPPRCPHAYERCYDEVPVLDEIRSEHKVACWWDTENGRPRVGG